MRTNVVVDDSLIEEAMRLSGLRTRRGVIDAALRRLIQLERQRAILGLEGTVTWEGDLNALRRARWMPDEVT